MRSVAASAWVSSFEEALAVLEQVHHVLPFRRGRLVRLADWFKRSKPTDTLPPNPRIVRPLPPLERYQ